MEQFLCYFILVRHASPAHVKMKEQNSVIHIRYASGDTRKILIMGETSLDNTFCITISK